MRQNLDTFDAKLFQTWRQLRSTGIILPDQAPVNLTATRIIRQNQAQFWRLLVV
jgi:hypothetical protein